MRDCPALLIVVSREQAGSDAVSQLIQCCCDGLAKALFIADLVHQSLRRYHDSLLAEEAEAVDLACSSLEIVRVRHCQKRLAYHTVLQGSEEIR